MPRLTRATPAYRKHKASGQALVTVNGRDVYLGPYGTRASHIEYDRVIAEWLAAGRQLPAALRTDPEAAGVTVAELLVGFWRHVQDYYRKPILNPDGTPATDAAGRPRTKPTTEVENFRRALRPLRQLYGRTIAHEFGPLALKAIRQHMIKLGWSRKSVNGNVPRAARRERAACGAQRSAGDGARTPGA